MKQNESKVKGKIWGIGRRASYRLWRLGHPARGGSHLGFPMSAAGEVGEINVAVSSPFLFNTCGTSYWAWPKFGPYLGPLDEILGRIVFFTTMLEHKRPPIRTLSPLNSLHSIRMGERAHPPRLS